MVLWKKNCAQFQDLQPFQLDIFMFKLSLLFKFENTTDLGSAQKLNFNLFAPKQLVNMYACS